jgi:hypothetical protein
MARFEYDVPSHSADAFRDIVYFCSMIGGCDLKRLPGDQVRKLKDMLNQRGSEGWELVQITFGKDGVLIFWKRMLKESES